MEELFLPKHVPDTSRGQAPPVLPGQAGFVGEVYERAKPGVPIPVRNP
jgi:hypothetical protein